MPTYEYICDNCGHEFEQFQSITARPLRKCPECGKANLKRLIGCGSGVIFKGPGFYETDYRSKNYRDSEKKERDSGEKKTATTKEAAKKEPETKTKESKPSKSTKPTTGNKKI
jgi:putative FmdB family regulatory protein